MRTDNGGEFWEAVLPFLPFIDGPLPFADVIAVGLTLLTVAATGSARWEISLPKWKAKDVPKEKEKEVTKPTPIFIYRYGGTNPGAFVPSARDCWSNTGLSFSTVPPMVGQYAAVTTMEQINATGVLYAVKDGATHVSVYPKGGTMLDWRMQGVNSKWTKAIKSVVIKYGG